VSTGPPNHRAATLACKTWKSLLGHKNEQIARMASQNPVGPFCSIRGALSSNASEWPTVRNAEDY